MQALLLVEVCRIAVSSRVKAEFVSTPTLGQVPCGGIATASHLKLLPGVLLGNVMCAVSLLDLCPPALGPP